MELLEIMRKRRSVRKYTGEMIPEKDLEKVLQAGLLSPSGRSLRPWEFILVRDKETLRAMSECRAGAAKMLEGADAAIVVIADAEKQDVWTEDCSIAMSYMHLTASALGLGSCWIHRAREVFDTDEGKSLLRQWGLEGDYEGIGNCILGYADEEPAARPRKDGYVIHVD